MKPLLLGACCVLGLGCSQGSPPATKASSTESAKLGAADRATSPKTEPADRTNTGVNARDRESTAKTPLDQNENQTDINTTAEIRKRIVAQKMSSNAHNVKIITQDGKVTLRGPVQSAEEKQAVEDIAKDVAGLERVDSQLEVNEK